MNPLDVFAILDQIPERLETALSTTSEFDVRSPRLARLLQELCPWASFSACILMCGGQSYPGASAGNNHSSGLIEQLQSSAASAPEERQRAWTALLNGENHSGLVQPLAVGERSYGLVGLRLPVERDSVEGRSASTILKSFARTLSLLLSLEMLEGQGQQTRQELLEQERLANTGELAGAVAHEFTNFLNLLLLQVSMLEYQLPVADHADLAEIRRQGNSAAEVVRQFLDYRRGQAPVPRLVDLNAILTDVAGELSREPGMPSSLVVSSPVLGGHTGAPSGALRLVLADDLPRVRSSRPDIQRLSRFLVGNALRAAGDEGEVHVKTTLKNGGVRLEIEDSGGQVSEEELPYLFDPGHSQREGVEGLELAACRSLVRRLRGSLYAENRSEGGVRVVVELPGSEDDKVTR